MDTVTAASASATVRIVAGLRAGLACLPALLGERCMFADLLAGRLASRFLAAGTVSQCQNSPAAVPPASGPTCSKVTARLSQF